MRILYCTPEAPTRPQGNAGLYVQFASDAMREAGHDVFVFTWTLGVLEDEARETFPSPNVCSVAIDSREALRAFPAGPEGTALAHVLRSHIERCIDRWAIDIVECADRGFAAYAFFQQARTSYEYRHLVLATYQHGLNIQAHCANLSFPDRAASDDLGSERQLLRLSDVIIAPSRTAADVARGLGVASPIELVAPPFRFTHELRSDRFSGRLVLGGPIGLASGLDRLALLTNQVSGDIEIKELYLIGDDAGSSLRSRSAVDLLAARLKPAGDMTVVATGSLDRADALDLLHARDLICAFDEAEAFDYFPLQALDRGLFPLARVGSPMSELFGDDAKDGLLPADLSDRREVVARCEAILTDKAERTAALQRSVQARTRPAAFAARIEAIYEGLRVAKGASARRRSASDAVLPSITVLIPAYDPPDSFKNALDSLARQSRPPDQILICDDGSTLAMDRWIAYARAIDLDPRVLRQRNLGLSGARNTLIEACETELALFLDCDDELSDNALRRMEEAWLAADKPDAVIPQRTNFGESSEVVIRQPLHDHLHFLRNEYRMTALIKTRVLRDIRFEAMRRNGEGDDWVFWLEFSSRGLRAEFVPETLFRYHFATGSMSWPWSEGQASGTAAMIAEVVAALPSSPRWTNLLSWAFYEFHGSSYSAREP